MTAEPKVLPYETLSGDIAAPCGARAARRSRSRCRRLSFGRHAGGGAAGARHRRRLAAGCWQQRTFDFAAINASCSSRVGMIYIVNRVSPSDRSFIGAIITASDDMIMAGQLPADGAGT